MCRQRPSEKRSPSRETGQFAPTPSAARLLPQTRRAFSFAVVQFKYWCRRDGSTPYGNPNRLARKICRNLSVPEVGKK